MFLWILAAVAAEPVAFEVVDIGTLGGRSSAAASINERGQIVGVSSTAGPEQHAFLWESGELRDLGTLGGRHSFAWDINDTGKAVGGAQDAEGHTRAVAWEGGQIAALGELEGGASSFALAVNDRGQVVGFSESGDGGTHAVMWDGGRVVDLGSLGGGFSYAVDVNERGEVLAMSTTPTGHRAFVWKDGERTEIGPEGALWSSGFDLNDQGQVVGSAPRGEPLRLDGYRWSPGGAVETFTLGGDVVIVAAINEAGDAAGYGTVSATRPGAIEAGLLPTEPPDLHTTLAGLGEDEEEMPEIHAFVFQGGAVLDIGTLGGKQASAVDINASGHVIGASARAGDGRPRAYVWREGGMIDLPTPPDASAGATDINDRGQVVGSWSYEGGRRAFVASPCPEGGCAGARRSPPGTR
jgi:probable HAF family extracellular repeat protein